VWAVVVAAAAAGGAVGSAVVAYLSLRWQKAVARQGVVDGQTARAQTSYLSGMDKLASPDRRARRVGAAELEFLSRDRTAGPYALRARAALDTGLADFLTSADIDLDGPDPEGGDSAGGQSSRSR
jgi:hypothetical protein